MECKDYEELENRQSEYVYLGGEDWYKEILEEGDLTEMINFLYTNTYEDIIMKMMPKNGSIEEFAKYLIKKQKKVDFY